MQNCCQSFCQSEHSCCGMTLTNNRVIVSYAMLDWQYMRSVQHLLALELSIYVDHAMIDQISNDHFLPSIHFYPCGIPLPAYSLGTRLSTWRQIQEENTWSARARIVPQYHTYSLLAEVSFQSVPSPNDNDLSHIVAVETWFSMMWLGWYDGNEIKEWSICWMAFRIFIRCANHVSIVVSMLCLRLDWSYHDFLISFYSSEQASWDG